MILKLNGGDSFWKGSGANEWEDVSWFLKELTKNRFRLKWTNVKAHVEPALM